MASSAPEHGRLVAVVVGAEAPVVTVVHSDEKVIPTDSGFTVLLSDAPERPEDADDDDMETMCLHCLIEDHPEVGRGLDLAKKKGHADRSEDGTWS
jgi:hypothetical protein